MLALSPTPARQPSSPPTSATPPTARWRWRCWHGNAARGLHDEARESLVRARMLTDLAGTTSAAAHQALTSAFCALCRGDLGEVVSLLEHRIAVDGGVGASGEPLGVAPLLVEAYFGLGRVRTHVHSPPATPRPHPRPPRRCRSHCCADARPSRPTARSAPRRHSTRRCRRTPRRRPVRGGADPAALRRPSATGRTAGRRTRRARRGTRRLRRDGADPLGHGRGRRTGRDRGNGPTRTGAGDAR